MGIEENIKTLIVLIESAEIKISEIRQLGLWNHAMLQDLHKKIDKLLEKEQLKDRQDKEKATIETMPNQKDKESHGSKCKCNYCKTHPEFVKAMDAFNDKNKDLIARANKRTEMG